jgi:pimeloyl-ACP methyl ester carboxylesterase
MKSVRLNDIELEYETRGLGAPVLLISPVLADGVLPLYSHPELGDRYELIRYHRRGWLGSTHTPAPVSIADHAADAAALLEHLAVARAHVAGHSSGASIATQLALDDPDKVHTLVLLEPTLFSVPSGPAFLEGAGPVLEAYKSGDAAAAVAAFLSSVSGLDWPTCQAVLDEHVPDAVANAIDDADTFFGIELPALAEWKFGAEAAVIDRPVLSVLGARTQPLWIEIAEFLRSSLPRVEERVIDGVGHFLHMERPEPVARAMVEFLRRNPMTGAEAEREARVAS